MDFQNLKHIFSIFIFCFLGLAPIKSQTFFPNDSIFNQVDSLPEFKNGVIKLKEYVHKNFYEHISKYKIESPGQSLWAIFVVEKNGSLSDVSCYPDTLEYAKGVINFIYSMPKWKPGIYHNQPVRTRVILPIDLEAVLEQAQKEVNTEDLSFFNLEYQHSRFSGKASNFLESTNGISFEIGFKPGFGSGNRLGVYISFLQPQIKMDFNRNQAFWEKGRRSNLLEVGVSWINTLFSAKNTELNFTPYFGLSLHTPSKHMAGDLIGIRRLGFSGGFGSNFLYFFNPRANSNKVAANLKLKLTSINLNKNLKGEIFNLSTGLVYYFY